jgi:hypothetical protein
VAVYAIDKCVKPDAVDKIYIANGVASERVLVELCGSYNVIIKNCYGDTIHQFKKDFDGISQIEVPVGGLITLER